MSSLNIGGRTVNEPAAAPVGKLENDKVTEGVGMDKIKEEPSESQDVRTFDVSQSFILEIKEEPRDDFSVLELTK